MEHCTLSRSMEESTERGSKKRGQIFMGTSSRTNNICGKRNVDSRVHFWIGSVEHHIQICQKSRRIGCEIPSRKLHCRITQPILRLFWHICIHVLLAGIGILHISWEALRFIAVLENVHARDLHPPPWSWSLSKDKFETKQTHETALLRIKSCVATMMPYIALSVLWNSLLHSNGSKCVPLAEWVGMFCFVSLLNVVAIYWATRWPS